MTIWLKNYVHCIESMKQRDLFLIGQLKD